jgi:hypothetical protein
MSGFANRPRVREGGMLENEVVRGVAESLSIQHALGEPASSLDVPMAILPKSISKQELAGYLSRMTFPPSHVHIGEPYSAAETSDQWLSITASW